MTSETENGAIKVTVTMEIQPEAFGKFIEAIPPDARKQLFVDGPQTFFETFAAAASRHMIESLRSSPELWRNWIAALSNAAKQQQTNESEPPSSTLPFAIWTWNIFKPPSPK